MHNKRNRRAARPNAPKIKPACAAPAFPTEVKIPPHRGAVSVAIEPPTVTGVALFAMPAAAKPSPTPKRRKPAAQRRKAPRTAKVPGKSPPRGPKLTSALPLPQSTEPLVEPLPRNRAPVLTRPGGLLARINDWLSQSAKGLWDRLGGMPSDRPAPRRKKASAAEHELIRLRAENARLKRQLEAIGGAKVTRPVSATN